MKWHFKFELYQRALARLRELVQQVNMAGMPTEVERDALIQRFEFSFELAWKTLQDYLDEMGMERKATPNAVLIDALSSGMLHDRLLWREMLQTRNNLSHNYGLTLAIQFFEGIDTYLRELEQLELRLLDAKRQPTL